MSPLTFINGILLGTAFSIFFGLAVVALLMAFLGLDTPRVSAEIRPLLMFSSLFFIMTVSSGLGFITLVKKHRLRWPAQGFMWLSWIAAGVWLIASRN